MLLRMSAKTCRTVDRWQNDVNILFLQVHCTLNELSTVHNCDTRRHTRHDQTWLQVVGRVAHIQRKLPFPTGRVPSSLCRSVCPFVTSVYCGKTANSIYVPFVMVGRVSPGNILDGDLDPYGKGQILGQWGVVQCNVYATQSLRKLL